MAKEKRTITTIIAISIAIVIAILINILTYEYVSDISVIDLGTLSGGKNSTAYDINDAGDIVGSSDTGAGNPHAFIIRNSTMTDIGTLAGGDKSMAYGINDLGQVVGTSTNAVKVFHAFMWQNNAMRDLGAYPPQDDIGSSSRAYAINNNGLIAGQVDSAGVVWNLAGSPNFPPYPPYVRVTDPGPFAPAVARDVNNDGKVTGTNKSLDRGFIWQAGSLTLLAGTSGYDEANGINSLGYVVGAIGVVPAKHAALWTEPSASLDIGTLGGSNSYAYEINDSKTVVGFSETTAGQTRAFIWRPLLGIKSLGTLGGQNSRAYSVNSAGDIVGESETASGEVHATLWKVTIKKGIKGLPIGSK